MEMNVQYYCLYCWGVMVGKSIPHSCCHFYTLKLSDAWTIKEFPVDLTLSLDLWEEVASTQREHAKTDLDPASKVSKTAATEQESKRKIVTLKFCFPQCD